MGKLEVNNEVVLMRPLVRKAKVHIVRNLIREIKILRVKRGDEKKLIKFKRRADRFLEEVKAAKKVKDDEVSKFGIVNTRSLYSILDDLTSDAHTRVIAKFADFPELKKKITEFKEKFPDYEQFIGPGKKKLARLQKKAAQKEKTSGGKPNEETVKSNVNTQKKPSKVKANTSNDEVEIEFSDNEIDVDRDKIEKVEEEDDEEKDEEVEEKTEDEVEEAGEEEDEDETSEETEEDSESETLELSLKSKSAQRLKPELENTTSESEIEVEKEPIVEKEVVNKKVPKSLRKEKVNSKNKGEERGPKIIRVQQNLKANAKEIKAISKEATVKRFAELLQEQEVEETSQRVKSESKSEKVELEKEVDNFFMTADGGKQYLSVVPKKKTENKHSINDDLEYTISHQGRNFSRNKNDRFFTNMTKFEGRSDKFKKDNMDRYNSAPKFVPRNEKRNWNETRSTDKFGNKSGKKTEAPDEHLHPSWAAKKKQQDAFKLGFQGKKIVFDDD